MKILLVFAFVLSLVSCQNRNEDFNGENVYKNDFESQFGWGDNQQLIQENPHSGKFCSKLSPEFPYSATFRKSFNELGVKKPKKIKVSAWFRFPVLDSDANLVVAIDSTEGKTPFFWFGIPAEDFIYEKNKWFKVNGEVDLPNNINGNYKLVIYAWSSCHNSIIVDDISFQLIDQ